MLFLVNLLWNKSVLLFIVFNYLEYVLEIINVLF